MSVVVITVCFYYHDQQECRQEFTDLLIVSHFTSHVAAILS
jgi:hypothetical protein